MASLELQLDRGGAIHLSTTQLSNLFALTLELHGVPGEALITAMMTSEDIVALYNALGETVPVRDHLEGKGA